MLTFFFSFAQKREVNLPRPPKFAPQKLGPRKPRSHTVGVDSLLSTSLEAGAPERKSQDDSSSLSHSMNVPMPVSKDAKTGQGKVLPAKTKSTPMLPPMPAQKGENHT